MLAQGRPDEAELELDTALRLAREIGNPCQTWQTYAAWGGLCRAQGRVEEACAAYRAALEIVEGVAARLTEASLRETLLGSTHVRGLRERAAGL